MKERSRTNFEKCIYCGSQMPRFAITPIIEMPDETWEPCCEDCANENHPGWDSEDELKWNGNLY